MFHLPEISNVVKSSFPHNTFLSIYIAVYRVYPALGSYIEVSYIITFILKLPLSGSGTF